MFVAKSILKECTQEKERLHATIEELKNIHQAPKEAKKPQKIK